MNRFYQYNNKRTSLAHIMEHINYHKMDKMIVVNVKHCLKKHLCVYKDERSDVTQHHMTFMQLVCNCNGMMCVKVHECVQQR
ncbi:hypothetical protein C923_02374 [Plasmodium falciparum UGT5.1]|uniref:Uncharacterized protein n=1 Tax=Plasmodium falciparum UGT5.1 TaxID=1237627 RepID=W7JDJ2_PLAFA|nr:hypothetical protein C923_02374 [Plasmodium falciparum UGT5.1]